MPADDAAMVAWLSGRGLGEDREPEFGLWIDVRATARVMPSALLGMVGLVLLARPHLRRRRSRPGVIGSFQADVDRVTGRVNVLRPAALRLAVAAATGIALHLAGASPLAAAVVAVLVLVMRAASWWVLVTGVVAVVLAPSAWLMALTAVVLAWTFYASADLRRLLDRPLGPGLGFVPLSAVLSMMRGGTWPLLADGLDKALGDDWQRAEPYLAAVEDRLPAGYRTVVTHARALVLGRQGEFARAFALLSDGPRDAGPVNLRAWCTGIEGELLMLAGQRAAALDAYRRAADGLRGRRTTGLRAELGFKLVDAAVMDRRWLDAYRELAVIRWQAVRTAALSLVLVTEGHVCRMMIAVGNTAGAVWELETLIVPTDTHRIRVNERGEATARWHLVLAEAHRMEGREDQAREQADMALTRAQSTSSPGLDAAAHLFLADLHRRGQPDRALRHACTALRRLQALRYQLPSASWRVQWLSTYAGAFSTAFDLAERAGDAPLVAELIEAVKSQGLPVASAGTSYGALAPAAAATGSVTAPAAPVERSAVATALAAVGVDVLTPPEPVLIGGTSWTQDDAAGGWDLEAEVRALAPEGWYWTGCIAADRYRWATLSPLGAWASGDVDLARGTAAADALGRLLAALPVRRPDEDDDDFQDRMAASPLVNGWGLRRDLERALMHDVAEALLPPPVRVALSATDPAAPVPLLVSLPGLLSTVPISALPVGRDGDTRVLEVALVAVAPAIATLAAVRRRGVTPAAPAESVIAVVDPDPARPLPHAAAPPSADPVLGRPATRADLQRALRARRPGRPGLLYVAAHHDVAEAFGSRGAGVSFADGLLGLQDLLDRSPSGEHAYPMPPVVLLSACDSLGALSSGQVVDRGGYGLESAGEWLGLVVGALFAGAEHVVSTSFPLLDDAVTTEMDQEIAAALGGGTPPSRALREVQLRHLEVWRSSASRRPPAVWQAYTYVGVGPVAARRQAGAPAAS